MVNYEFDEISAFKFFKKRILDKIIVKKIYLNWFINIKKRSAKNWKEKHSSGGGILFNYICHSIYYLESLFGKIQSIKAQIYTQNNIKILKSKLFFENGLVSQLEIKVGEIIKKIKPVHQLKIITNNKTFVLKSKLNSLSDKFELIEFSKKNKKTLFKNKKDSKDFRIDPTFEKSKKFFKGIQKKTFQKPSFFDAHRIHLIINKIIVSSKSKQKIYINQ